MTEVFTLAAEGISLSVSQTGGMVCDLTIADAGRTMTPLHRAPWVGTDAPELANEDPHLALLQGDFFCAPFGSDLKGSDTPAHGWPANGTWNEISRSAAADGVEARFGLQQKVHGATLEKRIALRHGGPVVYQTHVLTGGTGYIPLAHHAMIHVPEGAAISFSPKAFGATPDTSLEQGSSGRSILAYPQRFDTLEALQLADGQTVDARTYPFAAAHEDFVQLVEAPGRAIGWSAAVAGDFIFFGLKDARVLPHTMLWMSNGGRSYAPWNGRHTHVLGIEEGCSLFGAGVEASAASNVLSAQGTPTSVALQPQGEVVIRYALGAIARPQEFSRITAIDLEGELAVITDISGAQRALPFDPQFFDKG